MRKIKQLFSRNKPDPSTKKFDIIFTIFSVIFIMGAMTDGWAHNHIGADLDPFFTPWHAMMYGGFFLILIHLSVALLKKLRKNKSIHAMLPEGYALSAIGAVLFLIAGFSDMMWHLAFGVEEKVVDALLSPTHMILTLGAAMMIAGPLRVSWRKREESFNLTAHLPAVISLALVTVSLGFITQYASAFAYPWMSTNSGVTSFFVGGALGVMNIIITALSITSLILFSVKKHPLPFGSITLILTLHVSFLMFMTDEYRFILSALFAGITIDLILLVCRNYIKSSVKIFRVYSFVIPTVLFAAYFITLFATTGIWWSIHMWTGAIILAGFVGIVQGYLIVPPDSTEKIKFFKNDATIKNITSLAVIIFLASIFSTVVQREPIVSLLHHTHGDINTYNLNSSHDKIHTH